MRGYNAILISAMILFVIACTEERSPFCINIIDNKLAIGRTARGLKGADR